MRDSEPSKANGAAMPPVDAPHSVSDHGRRVQHDPATLAAELRGTAAGVERYLAEQVNRRPFGTLGAAAGIGYVLGGGLDSRLTIAIVGAAARLVAGLAVRELVAAKK